MRFVWTFRRQDNQAALTGILTVKKNNANAYSMAMNEWKNIIMFYKLYKTTIHVLVCKVGRKTCFVISISAVILKLMVKITSIFGSYRFLRIAWHDIFLLSHHLLESWNLYIPRVAGPKNAHLLVKFNAWTSQRLLIWNPIPKLTIVLTVCLKFVKTDL